MNVWLWLLIIAVFGIVVGNILLLKHSAKMKLPTPRKNNNSNWDDNDED